jgi:hypothetical protein
MRILAKLPEESKCRRPYADSRSRPRRGSKKRQARIIEQLPSSLRHCETRDLEETLFSMQRGLLQTYQNIERIQAELQRRERPGYEESAKAPHLSQPRD